MAQDIDEGWKQIGGPLVQTVTQRALYTSGLNSTPHVAALRAACFPDGLSVTVQSYGLPDLPYDEETTYDVVLAVDSKAPRSMQFHTKDPHVFIRIKGLSAKELFEEIADGSNLLVTANTASSQMRATFSLKGFFEVVIPALSRCL
jgi:hypothetical protein